MFSRKTLEMELFIWLVKNMHSQLNRLICKTSKDSRRTWMIGENALAKAGYVF